MVVQCIVFPSIRRNRAQLTILSVYPPKIVVDPTYVTSEYFIVPIAYISIDLHNQGTVP